MLFLSQKTNKPYKQCDPNHNTSIQDNIFAHRTTQLSLKEHKNFDFSLTAKKLFSLTLN